MFLQSSSKVRSVGNKTAEDIDSEAPLFGEGLSLDSIDALELALAVHMAFGVKTEEDDPKNPEYYHSVKSLAKFIEDNRP